MLFLFSTLVLSETNFAAAQAGPTTSGPLSIVPSCGWHASVNGLVVASSPPGSAVMITIGEPSWEQDCFSFAGPGGSTTGISFPAYEVFPITIQASPGETFKLDAGQAIPTAKQVAEDGVRNTTIWTWFSPDFVQTDSSGVGKSNLTLVGAVMPFVSNDISNVSLPIIAAASTGTNGSVGLPIEFEGSSSGGPFILRSPGPITFGAALEVQAGGTSQPLFSVVYSPPSSTSSSVSVSLQVVGTYENGKVGPMPSNIQASFPQSSFELKPYSVFYFPIAESNNLKPSNSSPSSTTYTLAVQEKIGNGTYLEPMTVTVSLDQVFMGGPFPAINSHQASGSWLSALFTTPQGAGTLIIIAIVIVLVLAAALVVVRRKRSIQKQDDAHIPPDS